MTDKQGNPVVTKDWGVWSVMSPELIYPSNFENEWRQKTVDEGKQDLSQFFARVAARPG